MKNRFISPKTLILPLFLSVFTNSFSASVKSETAQTVAKNFIQQKTGETKTISNIVIENYEGKPSAFGISFEGGGWVLVSTKEEMWPILAYNTKGEYVSGKESTNENFQSFLNMYGKASESIDSLAKSYKITSFIDTTNLSIDTTVVNRAEVLKFFSNVNKAQNKWQALLSSSNLRSYTPGSVLLKDERGENKWNQTTDINGQDIYNKDCPKDPNNQNCQPPVGCPAIALSQVMWKWRWPNFAEISQGAYLDSENPNRYRYHKPNKPLRGTNSSVGFDWDLIPASLVKATTPSDQIDETTRLLRLAGEAIHVGYGCDGTGIDIFEAYDLYPHAYKDMGYNSYGYVMSEYWYRNNNGWDCADFEWTEDQWNQLIKTEIDAERPVNYCNLGYDPTYYKYGYAVSAGHTYVISGYDIDDQYFFYCNLGWGGVSDGYYHIMRSDMFFGGLRGFVHSAVVGISPKYPDVSGEICLDYNAVNEGEVKGQNAKEDIVLPCDDKFDVYTDGTLKLAAGKNIKFKAGFSAHSGSTLNAKIISDFSENHDITVSTSTISDGTKAKLEFNVTNANSWYLTIRDEATQKVTNRDFGIISEDGPVLVWTGSISNSTFEVTFLNNYGHIDTYYGNFASTKLTKLEKPTNVDPADLLGYNKNDDYYVYAAQNGPLTDAIETSSSSQNLSIYPNPTNGFVSVKASSDNILSITVANLTGKVLMNQYVNSDLAQIDLSSYPKGIYIIQVVTESETIVEKLIVK